MPTAADLLAVDLILSLSKDEVLKLRQAFIAGSAQTDHKAANQFQSQPRQVVMRQVFSALFIASLFFSGHGLAIAGDGTAVGVKPQAQADNAGAVRTLIVGADVFSGERVITGRSGQVQIVFDDQTRLVVGPGSSLVIEDYLKRNNHTAGKVAIDALAGTFRFITGKSAKTAYRIKTPTGAIGVRGTAFDFTVDRRATVVMLFHGAVTLCNTSGKCVTLSKKCEIGSFDAGDAYVIGSGGSISTLRRQFPYAANQTPLLRPFRVAQPSDCLPRGSDTPASLDTSGNNGASGTGGSAPTRGTTPSTSPTGGKN